MYTLDQSLLADDMDKKLKLKIIICLLARMEKEVLVLSIRRV